MKRQPRASVELLTLPACLTWAIGGLFAMDEYAARPGAMLAADARSSPAAVEAPRAPFRLTVFVHAPR